MPRTSLLKPMQTNSLDKTKLNKDYWRDAPKMDIKPKSKCKHKATHEFLGPKTGFRFMENK